MQNRLERHGSKSMTVPARYEIWNDLGTGVFKMLKCLDKDGNRGWNEPQKGNTLIPPYWGGTFLPFYMYRGWNDEA